MTKFEKFQRFLITFLFVVAAFFGGWYFGKRGFIFEVRKNPPEIKILNQFPGDQTIDFDLFWQTWDLVASQYLLRPVDGQKMLYGAIQGMVSSLGDPYTSFLPPAINETITSALNGTYEGIGAELGIQEGQLIVVAPLDGSPAKEAGVRSGDKIVKIEDEGTAGITINEAVAKIRGQAGTIITLTLQRGNEEPFDVTIKRGNIVVASVTWADKGDGVAYIRLSRFGADTNKEWSKVASEVSVGMQNLDAVVLDLRGNPGGFLQSAIFVAGEFFKNEVVVYQESATGEILAFDTTRIGVFEGVPTYVLIDEGSASASEILAAALRSHSDAFLIGKKSFGKGTIQDARDFEDGSGIHLTVAKWLTPEKEWIHEVGLKPEVEVERTSEEIEQGVDSQLNKALELAKQGVIKAADIPAQSSQ
ncbi:hypothetical protein A2886_02125 [candidate division WWE3 bacterium RIFCSPHIGHO2_01_FULL_42_13]|uniref:PDZ domain-containing protein n=1 Tax=candidate division WWE3 bacterium RIFCSPHIGHO2_01_FULL_42_13 TaxID=1802617 RepID=A0A1F4URI1_UNCKA|nr:MAG: hypothetical protein A2886_02125 [candidate division WWE3 bacterium RIFCSPHIGHO2_01_FULL_42_13]